MSHSDTLFRSSDDYPPVMNVIYNLILANLNNDVPATTALYDDICSYCDIVKGYKNLTMCIDFISNWFCFVVFNTNYGYNTAFMFTMRPDGLVNYCTANGNHEFCGIQYGISIEDSKMALHTALEYLDSLES